MQHPILVHIPHSSIDVPKDCCEFLLNETELTVEVFRSCDLYIDSMIIPHLDLYDYEYVKAEVSRVVIDVERFIIDELEVMSSVGRGSFYVNSYNQKPLRILNDVLKQHLIDKYYHPHHRLVSDRVDDICKFYDGCVILDLHSYPSKAPWYEDVVNTVSDIRSEVCIGVSSYHTPTWLVDVVKSVTESFCLTYNINYPYSGTFIPTKHYNKDPKVQGIMIDINKSTYMNEDDFFIKSEDYAFIRQYIKKLLFSIEREFLTK